MATAIEISEERQYIEGGSACVFRDGDEYIYQDAFGYRAYKTLKGLNARIAKAARMANREAVEVTA